MGRRRARERRRLHVSTCYRLSRGHPMMRRTKPTSGSIGFGSPAASTQPAVVSRPQHSDRSYLAPVAGAVAARRLPPWFQVGLRSRSLSRFAGAPTGWNATTGIIVGVASACFRLLLINRLFHDAQHQPHPPHSPSQAEGRLGRRADPLRLELARPAHRRARAAVL